MANPIEFAKRHPVAIGAIVVGIIAVIFIGMSGGGSTSTVSGTASSGDASTGAALAQAQLQLQGQSQSLATQQAINDSNNAAAIQIAQIQQGTSLATINAQQQLGSMQIQADQATTINGQTLNAQVQNNQIAANLASTQAQFATIDKQTAALVQEAQIAKQPSGLLGWLLG